MADILGKYIKGGQFIVFCILVPLWWFGFAYEYSYFRQLGLVSNDYLGSRHYLYAGAYRIGLILFGLFVIGSIKRFFSNDIYTDTGKKTLEAVEKLGFKHAVWLFRLIFVITFLYWILSFVEFSKDWYPGMIGMLWLLFFWNLMAYLFTLATGEKHTNATLTIMFVIAITLVMSASGFLYARHALRTDAKPFRDDVVHIERDGDKFKVTTKSISIPVPYVVRFLDMVFD